jgi:hypothetical protein
MAECAATALDIALVTGTRWCRNRLAVVRCHRRDINVRLWLNGIKLVVTHYHIKGYSSSYRMHPRAVWTGLC